jgi:copper chaperone CopZ
MRASWNAVALVGIVLAAGLGGPWIVKELRNVPGPARAARGGEKVVTLEVGGMTCGGCAAKVQAEIASLPGVSRVAVRLEQNRAHVVCDAAVADTSILAAVHRAGPGFLATVATP